MWNLKTKPNKMKKTSIETHGLQEVTGGYHSGEGGWKGKIGEEDQETQNINHNINKPWG